MSAKDSYNDFASAQLVVSFPCPCLARARNPESGAGRAKRAWDSSRGSHARE
jgi:hypothetical protein